MKKVLYITLFLGILVIFVPQIALKKTDHKSSKTLIQQTEIESIKEKNHSRNLTRINRKVELIESDTRLIKTVFDWVELTNTATDGGGILAVWQNKKQTVKIVEEVGLSYGQIKTTIYLHDAVPIKIIETEKNFGFDNDEFNYRKLNEVFKATIYLFNGENDEIKIEQEGKRVFSEGSDSISHYEQIIELAQEAISE